jgi:aspartate racemase
VKTIGLIGGMSWESSSQYYRIINQTVKARLGGLHSARSVMVSVDFAEIERLQHEGRWDEAAELMVAAAQSLERAGADCVLLCTNTMHKLADRIEAAIRIPFLHIADATAARVRAAGVAAVGLLGTRFTMEESFYRGRLADRHGLSVLLPAAAERELVHRVIYDELCLGVIREESRTRYAGIIRSLVRAGAQGIVLGCTEIELLVRPEDSPVPLFPTTAIHAQTAVDFALAGC